MEVGIEYSVYEAVVVDDYILEAGTCSVGGINFLSVVG